LPDARSAPEDLIGVRFMVSLPAEEPSSDDMQCRGVAPAAMRLDSNFHILIERH